VVHEKKNIYLIGPMGSGKTTIGNRLAQKLGLSFYDSDHEIETRTGASVSLIFEIEGERGFRKREHKMLQELCSMNGVLVATGGGAVVNRANRDLLRKSGVVIYLRTSIGQQLERLVRDRTRPLLQTRNRESRLTALANERNPLYEETADLVFPVKNRNIDNTVERLYKAISRYRSDPANGPRNTHDAGSDT
jgi:shikimate kinase